MAEDCGLALVNWRWPEPGDGKAPETMVTTMLN